MEFLWFIFRIWRHYHEIVFVVDVVDFILIGDGEMDCRGLGFIGVKHGDIVYIKTGNPFVFSF